jgi:hypothetical protein
MLLLQVLVVTARHSSSRPVVHSNSSSSSQSSRCGYSDHAATYQHVCSDVLSQDKALHSVYGGACHMTVCEALACVADRHVIDRSSEVA